MMLRAILLALTLTVSACAGTNFNWDTARQIKPGMTEQEVTALMGRPYLVKSAGSQVTWVWSHANALGASKAVSVVFVDGKVSDAPAIPESFK